MENFDLTQLTNEELSDLQNLIYFEKQNRAKEKEKKLVDAFRMAWDDLEKEGIEIWFSGNEYTAEDDFRLKFDEIYFD